MFSLLYIHLPKHRRRVCAPFSLVLLLDLVDLSQSKFTARGLAHYNALLFVFAGFTVHVVKLLQRSSKTLTDSVESKF